MTRKTEGHKMKTISAFLLACGILSAQAPQAPNPTQQLNREYGPDGRGIGAHLSGYRGRADHEGDQLQPPQRIHEDRLSRHSADAAGHAARPRWRASRA